MAERIPVTVLTGFLGSGKTTVLNHLVQQPAFADTLVIINEFGQVSLDHLLVAHSTEGAVVEMGNGCVCCTIRTDLARTLRDIIWRFSRQGQRQFRQVWIETTGLADPVPILQTLLSHPQVAPRYQLQGVVTTVSLNQAAHTLATYAEAVRQVAVADVVLLTQEDQAAAAQVPAVAGALRQINPAAPQWRVSQGVVEAAALQALGALAAWGRPGAVQRLDAAAATRGVHHQHHHHQHPHEHHESDDDQVRLGLPDSHAHFPSGVDLNRHGASIRAHSFYFDTPIAAQTLQAWLAQLPDWAGPALLRMKGVLAVAGQAQPVVVHAVRHTVYPPSTLPGWPAGVSGSCVVLITDGYTRAELAERVALLGAVSIPTPS